MKIADYGSKEIHARIATGTAMYELFLTGGGVLPKEISGLYSTTRDASRAFLTFQGRNSARMAKNARPTQAAKKHAKAKQDV